LLAALPAGPAGSGYGHGDLLLLVHIDGRDPLVNDLHDASLDSGSRASPAEPEEIRKLRLLRRG
jgi:hypothetical protein